MSRPVPGKCVVTHRRFGKGSALIERCERRLLLAVTQTHISTGHTFTWDAVAQGRTVIDSGVALRSLLDSPLTTVGGGLFLDLSGIDGDSTAKGFEKDIPLLEFEFGIDRDRAGTDAGGPNFTELHLVGQASRHTPKLLDRLQLGTTIPSGIMKYVLPIGGTGMTEVALQVSLQGIHIRSYRSTTALSGRLTEEYTLGFTSATVEYRPATSLGYTFSWNVETQGDSVGDLPLPERRLIEEPEFSQLLDEAFLRIDGISGTSTVKGQENKVPIEAFSWSMDATDQGPAIGAMHFVAETSSQTPLLIDHAARGTSIVDVDLIIRRPLGTTGSYYYTLEIDLDNVVVSSHRISTVTTPMVAEEFTLTFSAYSQQISSPAWATEVNTYDLKEQPGSMSDPTPGAREVLFEEHLNSSPQILLQLSGVTGESRVKGYEGFIDVNDFEWGVDFVSGKPRFNPLHVIAPTSIASPVIIRREAERTTIATAKLLVFRPDSGSGSLRLQSQITLSNVKVESYRVDTLHAGKNVEEFQLSFDEEEYSDVVARLVKAMQVPDNEFSVVYSQRSILDSTPPGGAGSDAVAYLGLTGIDGEVTQKGFENKIDVLSFEWGQFVKSGIRYDELRIVVPAGKSSPALMSAVTNGTLISAGTLETYRPGNTGLDFRCFSLGMTALRIGSLQTSTSVLQGGMLCDEIALRFESFTLTTTSNAGVSVSFSPSVAPIFVQSTPAREEPILDRGHIEAARYLRLDAIEGDVTQKGQEKKIEVLSFEWAVDRTSSVHFTEMHFVAPSGRITPQLKSYLAVGTVMPTGDLVVGRTSGGSGVTTFYYKLDFTQALVSSVRTSSRLDGQFVDEFTLRFAASTLTINPASTTFTYNITNSSEIYDSKPADRPLARTEPVATPGAYAYLFLDGLNGGVTVKGQEGSFEVVALEWGTDRSVNTNPGGPDFGELRFATRISRGTPFLMDRLAQPTLITGGMLRLYRLLPNGTGVLFQTIVLSNMVVSSHSLSPMPGVGMVEEFTLAVDQPTDLEPPTLLSQTFVFETKQAFQFAFSEDVIASLNPADFIVQNLTTGLTLSTAGWTITPTAASSYELSPPVGIILSDGNYRVTINAAGVQDVAGNLLFAASAPPLLTHVLAGDANRDKKVNFDDLLVLSQNYGTSGRVFSQGNFDYSVEGFVGFDDLLIVAQRYGVQLLQASIATPIETTRPAKRRPAVAEGSRLQ